MDFWPFSSATSQPQPLSSYLNPTCYLPSKLASYIPSLLACPLRSNAPVSYLSSFLPRSLMAPVSLILSPVTATISTTTTTLTALLSLPLSFLSVLLIPSMTSTSTSLNLLFFYLTWSTLVLSHSALKVEIVSSVVITVLCYLLPSIGMLVFDMFVPSWSKEIKSLGSKGLPVGIKEKRIRGAKRREDEETRKVVKAAVLSLCNVIIGLLLQLGIEYAIIYGTGSKSGGDGAINVTTTLPLPLTIAKDLFKGLLLRDALSYAIHRYLLHPPQQTRNALTHDLSQLHKTWYHDQIQTPYPLSATYDHPLCYILYRFIPFYLPAVYFNFHALTFILYHVLTSLEMTFTHSGYASLPLMGFVWGGIARRNEVHCLNGGDGNFGTWGVIDWILGTIVGGDIVEELMMEVEDAEVERRVKRGVGRVRRKVVRRVRQQEDEDAGEEVGNDVENELVNGLGERGKKLKKLINGRGKSSGSSGEGMKSKSYERQRSRSRTRQRVSRRRKKDDSEDEYRE